MKKKLVVVLLTVAVVTTSMLGTAQAAVRIAVAEAGAPSWSGVFVKGSTNKHKKGVQSAVTVKETTEANVKSSGKFTMKGYAEALHKEANKKGYKYNVKKTFKAGYALIVKEDATTGNYGVYYQVLGSPMVGDVDDDSTGKSYIDRISWIGKDMESCKNAIALWKH